MKKDYILLVVLSLFLVSGCATYKAKYSEDYSGTDETSSTKKVEKTFIS